MSESNLVITITNNTDKKIYTSFLAPGDSDKVVSQRITTDSSTSSWQPPVLQAATNCKCDFGSYSCDPSQTQLTIPIKTDSSGVSPWSTIYFSNSPGYQGGKDGTFDTIPVNHTWDATQAQDPQYSIGANSTSCKSPHKTPYIQYIIIGILFVASIALIVISILLKNKLWIFGVSLLLILVIFGLFVEARVGGLPES
tara:strand:+ start:1465 stop:2055 length:591 start_codon:yes stop_codon:yes gene_type:complete